MFKRVGGVIALVGFIATLIGAFPALATAQGGRAGFFGLRPDGDGIGVRGPNPLRGRFRVQYHGGPVMLGVVNIYYIWYGNWAGHDAQPTVVNFLSDLNGSAYLNINTLYSDRNGSRPSNQLGSGGSPTDGYSHGTTLTRADVAAVVRRALDVLLVPMDPNGIYFVLGSSDVTVSGFCTAYCGWHNHLVHNGTTVRYAFIGNPAQCPNKCMPQQTVSPNFSVVGDAMASLVAALISTTTTDPQFTAWYDLLGFENADKCAWNFGRTYPTPNGALANIKLGPRDYLLQQNWVPTARGGFCSLGVNP